MLKEFREFALKGNVVDLAVGVIIGAAFGTVIKSLVDDLLMPVLGLFLGGIDVSNRFIILKEGAAPMANETLAAAREAGATVFAYGRFLNNVLTFLIVAWAVFLLVKGMNRTRRRAERAPATPTSRPCPECLTQVPAGARKCSACASPLEPVPSSATP